MSSFTKKEQIAILIIVLSIVFLLGFQFIKSNIFNLNKENELISDIIVDNNLESVKEIEKDEKEIIMVHISGEVFNPGLITLFSGDRVVDAVNLAGGLKKDADLDMINLAKKLYDEEKIYIPKIGEELKDTTLLISTESPSNSTGQNKNSTNKININSCNQAELESLPGIGSVIAGRIMEYRKSNPFKSIDEIKNVSGIADKKFEGIKDLITVK